MLNLRGPMRAGALLHMDLTDYSSVQSQRPPACNRLHDVTRSPEGPPQQHQICHLSGIRRINEHVDVAPPPHISFSRYRGMARPRLRMPACVQQGDIALL